MSVGGLIIDIVKVSDSKWWINTIGRTHSTDPLGKTHSTAVYVNPMGEHIDIGDTMWWQGGSCYWTPVEGLRKDVRLPKIGYSGVGHPDRKTQSHG